MCMGFWQTPTRLVSSFSHEVDNGLLSPSRCGSAFLQEVFTLLQADESWSIPGPRTVSGVARWLAHHLGQGGHRGDHLCPSKVVCWSTSQEDRSPPVVCLGGVRPKTYFLDSWPSLSLEEGKHPLCLVVVCSMRGWICLSLERCCLTWAGKKNSLGDRAEQGPTEGW